MSIIAAKTTNFDPQHGRLKPMLLTALSLTCVIPGIVGTTLSVEQIGTIPAATVASEVKRYYGRADKLPNVASAISLYAVKYWSNDAQGIPVVVSGLVALPEKKATKGLVLFYHGTTADRRNVPSAMGVDGKRSMDTYIAALAFAGGNYALVAPDYLGLGAHEGIHPYAQSINGGVGKDLVTATRNFAASKQVSLNNKLFVTGYSEGGGIAMWSARQLWSESDKRLHPTAAAPLAGPYDLSDTMAKTVIKRARSPLDTAIRLYFMSYFAYGLPVEKRVPLTDLFVPSFATYIPRAFELGGSDGDIGKRLANKALQVGGLLGIDRVVQGDTRKAIREQNQDSPLLQALRENDCYAWKPSGPLYLVGLIQDGVVPFDNTRKAVRAMRSLGVVPAMMKYSAITTREMDHGGAAAPSLALARRFFDSGFNAVPSDPDPIELR